MIITPLVSPFAFVYFCLAYVVYKHQLLYVYVTPTSRAAASCRCSSAARSRLHDAQCLLVVYFFVNENYTAVALTVPLPVLSNLASGYLQSSYFDVLGCRTRSRGTSTAARPNDGAKRPTARATTARRDGAGAPSSPPQMSETKYVHPRSPRAAQPESTWPGRHPSGA